MKITIPEKQVTACDRCGKDLHMLEEGEKPLEWYRGERSARDNDFDLCPTCRKLVGVPAETPQQFTVTVEELANKLARGWMTDSTTFNTPDGVKKYLSRELPKYLIQQPQDHPTYFELNGAVESMMSEIAQITTRPGTTNFSLEELDSSRFHHNSLLVSNFQQINWRPLILSWSREVRMTRRMSNHPMRAIAFR